VRFLAFLGTLSRLAEAAEERRVLVIADDAHWLDEASANALLFVARRLQAERVALLFAARDGVASGFDAGELPCLNLGGLSGEAAGQLLGSNVAGGLDAAVRGRLVGAPRGDPPGARGTGAGALRHPPVRPAAPPGPPSPSPR